MAALAGIQAPPRAKRSDIHLFYQDGKCKILVKRKKGELEEMVCGTKKSDRAWNNERHLADVHDISFSDSTSTNNSTLNCNSILFT
jgi:hypothetical protein